MLDCCRELGMVMEWIIHTGLTDGSPRGLTATLTKKNSRVRLHSGEYAHHTPLGNYGGNRHSGRVTHHGFGDCPRHIWIAASV